MVKVRYVGPHPAVDLPTDGDPPVVVVQHGHSVDVSEALAASLCEQESNWQAVKADKPAKDGDRA